MKSCSINLKQNIESVSHMLMLIIFTAMMLISCENVLGQENKQVVRLAKLVIDSTQLEKYKMALKEGVETAVRLESGVLTLYAVSEKNNPTHITILEIYADSAAYKTHLKTPHFIKYKADTNNMVKSLELVETIPLVPAMKIK
jgi:quinol monooxygenase YgiN